MLRKFLFLISLLISIPGLTGCSFYFDHWAYTSGCTPTLVCLRELPPPLRWYSAHRGGGMRGGSFIENTLPAIRHTAAEGIRLLEVDIRVSSDGVPFLLHDHTLKERNFSGPAAFRGRRAVTLQLSQLKDVCMPEDPHVCIPTFRAALDALEGSDAVFQLDLDGDGPETALRKAMDVASESERRTKILVQCPSVAFLKFVKMEYPGVAVLLRASTSEDVRSSFDFHPEVIQIDEEWASEALIAEIHAHGSKILIKVLDELGDTSAHKRALFDKTIDIVLTDYPF